MHWFFLKAALDLLVGKFYQFFTELTAYGTSLFSFKDILSKSQWIFTKLDMCIDIVEIWFVIADGQISSIFDRDLPMT